MLLAVEALVVIGYLAVLIAALLRHDVWSESNGFAYIVVAVIAAIWVVGCALGAFLVQPWIRGAVITWQIVLLIVAIGCFEGLVGTRLLGIPLLLLALGGFALAVLPSTTAALTRGRASS